MKIFRFVLPLYKKTIEKFSQGKGYGKNKSAKKMLRFFDLLFRSNEIDVHGHRMFLTEKGFEEYSTQGIYGELDTLTVERLIKPGDMVVDVGAAIGYFTLIFARSVGKDGMVFAFEPKKDRFEILLKNIKANNYSNVKIERKAIMEKNKKVDFFSRDNGIAGLRYIDNTRTTQNSSNNEHKIPEEVITIELDDYLRKLGVIDDISFMKTDVDGPELLVLQGSRLLLKNKNLKIIMEWDKALSKECGCEPSDMIDLLIDNEFRMFYPNFEERKYYEVSKDELLKMPDKVDQTINMLFVKDLSILEKNGLI
ncbi:MAG: FkbM family methyltransferase [Candidatus Nitrosopelagicus sp.]|nr:FkbM family methyltransferase [Candidatus Nitrosopelagicus sp.]